MARTKNSLETIQVTLSTTLQIKNYLEQLTSTGLYGKNVAETATLLIQDQVKDLLKSGDLVKLPPMAPIES
ncbi:MAG: hypothetical protein R3F19_23305 [Verrucomicrobiales bacterium]|nr:hypothetical protein [Verrucomicrobiae bacterium]